MDTRSKRASALALALPFVMALPAPDGTIEQRDRQHVAMSYSGVLTALPTFPDVIERATSLVEMCFGGSYRDWIAERGTCLHHWYLSDLLTTIAKDEITGYGSLLVDLTGQGTYVGIPVTARGLLPEYGLSTRFDGVNDGVTLPSLAALGSTCTVAILVKASGAGANTTRCLIHTGPTGLYLGLNTTNKAVFGANGGTLVEAAHTINADETYLIVGTYSGGNARIYVAPADGSDVVVGGPTAVTLTAHGVGEIGVNASAARFNGDLQGAAVFTEALALADVEALQAATVWTDIGADVEIVSPVTTNRGMHDDSPLARMAATGTASLVLDNSIRNSAELQGYYSPDHANAREGFDRGTPLRIAVPDTSSPADYRIQFIGTVISAKILPGIYRDQRVLVTATDWFDEAARAAVVGIPIQVNLRPENLLAVLINAMRHKPHQVNFQTGLDTYVYALHTTQDEAIPVQAEIKKITDSEYGWSYMRGDGTLVFEARDSRDGAGSPVDHVMTDVIDLDQERARDQLKNRVKVTVHPSRIDDDLIALYSLVPEGGSPSEAQPMTIAVGAQQRIFLAFRSTLATDIHGQSTRIGAIDVVEPEPVIDYEINSAEDGSGTDLTSHLTVDVEWELGGNGVYLKIINTYGADIYFTHLQVRGRGVYDFQPLTAIRQDDNRIAKDGTQELTLDMPYQPSLAVADVVATAILEASINPATRIRSLTFLHAESADMHESGATGEIGHVVNVSELMSGVDHDYDLQGIKHEIGEEVMGYDGISMNLIKTTWYLAPRILVADVDACAGLSTGESFGDISGQSVEAAINSFAHTVVAGETLIVWAYQYDQPILAATYADLPLTLIALDTGLSAYYMANPPVGTANVAITIGVSRWQSAQAHSIADIDMSAVLHDTTGFTDHNPDWTVPTTPGTLVLSCVGIPFYDDAVWTPGAGQTALLTLSHDESSITRIDTGTSRKVATGATTTMDWSITGTGGFPSRMGVLYNIQCSHA